MQKYKMYVIALGFLLISLLIGYFVAPHLPAQIASHWNAQGEADGYTSRASSILFMPIFSFVITCFIVFVPTLDPKNANITKFLGAFHWFTLIFMCYFFYIHLLTLAWNLGYKFNFTQMLAPGFALLFYACGVMLGKSEPNWTIGIRTPWTLSNPIVWEKTHKVGALAFKLVALCTLIGVVLPVIGIWLMLISIVGVSFGLTIYSYLLYRQQEKKHL